MAEEKERLWHGEEDGTVLICDGTATLTVSRGALYSVSRHGEVTIEDWLRNARARRASALFHALACANDALSQRS